MPRAVAVAEALMMVAVAASFLVVVVEPVVSGPHIADLNVLLPPRMTNPVQYLLVGTGGCFSWSWDHHDILSVQPEYNGSNACSASARLISIAPYNGRKETAVYATDLESGTVIRCEVFIDIISSIKIFHHSVKLDLDGFATLHIRAFDHDDNVFSSLVGLQFLWQLEPIPSDQGGFHHLIHVPLKETPLSDCGGFCGDLETQISLEDRGVGSDLYVVKGIEIGHEVVTSHLLEPNLEHIADKIFLTVAEAMSIDPPSPLFVTIGALVRYSLRVIRLTTTQVIDLPSRHHRWSVKNSSVAQVDSMMGIAHTLNLGSTEIIVEDTRVSGHMQTSSLHIVIPEKLCLYITPVLNAFNRTKGIEVTPSSGVWYVFPGQDYIIHMKLFSQGSNAKEIYITENNDVKLESDTEYWDVSSVSDDVALAYGRLNSRLLKPISPGEGIVTASLSYYSSSLEIQVLKAEQEVTVCSKVKFIMKGSDEYSQVIYLPWAPGIYQEVELNAIGGCTKRLEDYNWFSSDEAIVTVSASGLLLAKWPGLATVKVVSGVDPINYDEVLVEVSIPSSMVMLPTFPVEAVVGTQLHAAVTLKTSKGYCYCRCDAFNSIVRWKVFSETETFRVVNTSGKLYDSDMLAFKEGSNTLTGPVCAWGHLYASAAGRAMLHAILSIEPHSSSYSFDGPIFLKAASTIAAYSPLLVYQTEDGSQFGGYWVDMTRIRTGLQGSDYVGLDKLFLAPGSGMDVLLFGGPERWDQRVEYIETVDVLDELHQFTYDAVVVWQTSHGSRMVYRVTCQTLGNFKIIFSRGNLVGDGHPMPVVAKTELPVICSFPSSITIIVNEPANTLDVIEAAVKAERGLGKLRTSPVTVANNCTIRIAATGIHMTKRPFANSSSLCLTWELSGCEELAHWSDTDEEPRASWERFLVLNDASGICTIRATVIGFCESVASHLYQKVSFSFEISENILTDAVPIQLVSLLRVIPESVLLVFDPEAKVNLSVIGGTCFLETFSNDTQVVQISQPPESPECSHLMLSAVGLGVALVTVRDVGLYPPAAASSLVKVTNVDWIKIIAEEEIRLMKGTTKAFDILAGTEDGTVFGSSQFVYMKILVHIDECVLELINMNDSSRTGGWIVHGPRFFVRASDLGITTLHVSVRQQSGHEILSQFIKVEVYQPLQINPEYIYLMPGASYTLTVEGGPKTGVFIEYASMHDETARVHRSLGKVSAVSVGNATVRATAYVNGGAFICEAYGNIEVGIPTVASLNLQSDQLCVHCKMPVFPSFRQGDLFSFYEVCKDYKWIVEDEKVLSLEIARSSYSGADEAPLSGLSGKKNPYYMDSSSIGFINVVVGRSAGRTKILVSFTCDIVSPGTQQSISYDASVSVRVVADLPLSLGTSITWILPPFYITSDLLPVSSESHGHLDSRKHKSITYSVLKAGERNGLSNQDDIAIDGSKIRTLASNKLACIQAKDWTTGRTEIASCVRVAEVSQIRAATRESSHHVAYLTVNSKVELVISYCDDLGYPFYEAHGVAPLKVETNYPDIISILLPEVDNNTVLKNGNIFLQARSPGRALVKTSIDHSPGSADFILVSVGSQLFPRNPVLHVGQHLNLSIVGDDAVAPGRWVSGNESVIIVNEMSGEMHACGEGIAQVIFEGSNSILQTMVTVLKVDKITVEAPVGTLTNIPFPTKGYKFSVRFSGPFDKTSETIANHIEVPYECSIDPPFIGYSKPWVDHVTGDSYCLFFPYSPKHLLISASKTEPVKADESTNQGALYISVIASLKEAPQAIGSAHAFFIGGFSIIEGEKLNLTPNSNKSLITIIGNTDLEIHWRDKELLSVRPVKRVGSGIVSRVEYEVKVLAHQQFKDKVIFVLPTTGQKAEIDVSYELGEEKMPARMSFFAWVAVLISGIIVLILTIAFFMRLLDRPESSSMPPRLEAPVTSPATPERTTTGSIPSSPHTPQPFIDHVRRTIDDTPYYRRHGRRRFDPQYTY